MTETQIKATCAIVLGASSLHHWSCEMDGARVASVKLRVQRVITLDAVQKLADALGTNAINFYFGEDGSPGYSSWTPGAQGEAGWIEVFFRNEATP